MLFSAPLDVARTNACTFASRWTSASVRCEPMKPSAPVTRTVRPPKTSPNSRRSAASESSVQGEPFPVTFIVGGCPSQATESMPRTRKSAVRSGIVTGVSSLAVAGSAAGAGFLQLVAALAASALAARDSYGVAALAYSVGAVLALVLFAALHHHGEVSLAWAITANGVVTAGIPLAALAWAGALTGMRARGRSLHRLGRLATGAAVPIALQAMFVVALRFAGGLGAGKATSLNYAYLIAAVLVVATASSVALISSAPLTRRGIDVEEAVTHVVHSSWLSLALIAAAAGVFALAGGRVVGPILGGAYGGEVGRELGRLVAYLAPWMVVSVAFTLTFPLLFVLERSRGLVAIAVGGLAVSIPIAFAGRELAGLGGIAGALAVSTALVLAALLVAVSGAALRRTAAELGRPALQVAALAAVTFGLASLLGGFAGAAVGLAAYAALLAALRPRGLREAWSYVRALH